MKPPSAVIGVPIETGRKTSLAWTVPAGCSLFFVPSFENEHEWWRALRSAGIVEGPLVPNRFADGKRIRGPVAPGWAVAIIGAITPSRAPEERAYVRRVIAGIAADPSLIAALDTVWLAGGREALFPYLAGIFPEGAT